MPPLTSSAERLPPPAVARATISKPTTSLSGLPAASEAAFGGRAPWSVITTRTLVALLHLDRGVFATWRCRGIGPAELPATWFKPASGRPNYFLVTDVMAWLAARRDEPFDTGAAHRDYLISIYMPPDPLWVLRLAEREGPVQGEIRFTPPGWRSYLDRIAG